MNGKWRVNDGEKERYTSRNRNLNKSTNMVRRLQKLAKEWREMFEELINEEYRIK